MKFMVTYTPISPITRRRTGKSRTEVVDTAASQRFTNLVHPVDIEQEFERMLNHQVKVIDVREVS